MAAAEISLPLRIGTRTLLTLRRRLARLRVPLAAALAQHPPPLPALGAKDHGWFVTGLPVAAIGALRRRHPAMQAFVRQSYDRHYADFGGGFDEWFAGLSANARSSLKRKRRRLEEISGGALDVRVYRSPDEIEDFYELARPLSARTWQERKLDFGLPCDAQSRAESAALAHHDQLRAFLLFARDRPIAYLYTPAEGDTLVYAYLGYDPDFAEYSPGALLQLEAMRALMAERRFLYFDFAEGDARHKRQFASSSVASVDLLLLKPGLANRLIGRSLVLFDAFVAKAKRLLR
jgi:CelD/BcsL family acetyltransferase involved in cellulose biosynthesis